MGHLVRPAALVVGFAVALLATSCADPWTRDAAVESFVAANDDATTEQAGCVVDSLIAAYGLDGLEVELEAEVMDDDFEIAQFKASFACGMTADVEETLVDQLEQTGIDPLDAECAAEALVADFDESDLDVLLSGELNDTFYATYFDALEQCDALPNS